jgi:hypothetical protein
MKLTPSELLLAHVEHLSSDSAVRIVERLDGEWDVMVRFSGPHPNRPAAEAAAKALRSSIASAVRKALHAHQMVEEAQKRLDDL